MSVQVVATSTPTPAGVGPGEELVMSGSIRSSFDGASFGPADVFDLAAGGLAMTGTSGDAIVVRASGAQGASCAVAGVASPCLVPRFAELAHARLLAENDFRASLSGGIAVSVEPIPVPPPPPPSRVPALVFLVALVTAAMTAFALLAARARARTPLGRVHAAARRARRAMRSDSTYAATAAQIDALVARAEKLDVARRAAISELARIDRASLDRKRDAWSRSPGDDARAALDWLTAESAEAARITSDLESSQAGLERIAAALRVTALRAREHRGARARVAVGDPVDALADELSYREEAIAELSMIRPRA
jgi:hypothetical protein